MLKIQALIFDFDGLILDTESSCFAAWQMLFAAHGSSYTLTDYAYIVGSDASPRALFEARCGQPADWPALEARRRAHEDDLNRTRSIQPGVVALLDQAQALGLRLAVASSSSHAWVDGHLRTHNLLHRFETTVCRNDVRRVKPEPDLYLEAVRRLGVPAHAALAIEDSHHGSLAAKRAGLWCLVVPNAITQTQDFSHADWCVPTLEDLDLAALLATADRRAG